MRALASHVDGPVGNMGGAGDTLEGTSGGCTDSPTRSTCPTGPLRSGNRLDIPVFHSPYYY